jgi:integrase
MASGPTFNEQRGFWYVQYFDGGTWRRVKVADGPPRWRPGDPKPKAPPEAKAAFARWQEAEVAARAGKAKGRPTSLEDFLREHVASYEKPGTRKVARVAVEQFLDWCRREGIARFDEVDKATCNRWIRYAATHAPYPDDPGSRPLSRKTLEMRRDYLAAAWGRLVSEETIARNPWVGTEVRGEDRTKPRNAWTREQFDRLLAVAEPWLRDVLVFGVNTGLRIEALMRAEWDDWIKPEGGEQHHGYILVRKELSKSGRPYKVPVSEELYRLLCRRLGKHDPKFILTAKMGKPISAPRQTARGTIAACAAAGLPYPQAPNHHLRRTFGRWAIRGQLTGQPVPLYTVSKWLGHSQVQTTMIYLDLEEEESAKSMVPHLYRASGAQTPPEATPDAP